MNRYGKMAQSHWAQADPSRYAAIPNPDDFFRQLGEQVEQQIQDLATQLAGADPVGEGYLEKVGRLNMARLQAEEQVLAEMVWIARDEQDSPETASDLAWEVQQAMDAARRETDPQD